jgi:hypothetical protein
VRQRVDADPELTDLAALLEYLASYATRLQHEPGC